MKKWIWLLVIAVVPSVWGDMVLLPPSPQGQIWVKQVPRFPVLSVRVEGDPFVALEEEYFRLQRWAAVQKIGKIQPVVIEFPDLEWKPGDEREAVIYLPLPSDKEYGIPSDTALVVDDRSTTLVGSVSFSGGYKWKNLQPRMAELMQWIRDGQRIVAGQPRLLIYHFRAFRPDFFREAELQIPIR